MDINFVGDGEYIETELVKLDNGNIKVIIKPSEKLKWLLDKIYELKS